MSPLQSFYSVPVLNLKAFQQDDLKVSRPLELIDYPDTGRSGISTIRYHTQILSINIHELIYIQWLCFDLYIPVHVEYCKQTFIRMWEIFVRASLSWKIFTYISICHIVVIEKTGDVDNAWSQKLISANKFISGNLWNIVIKNDSWFTVSFFFSSQIKSIFCSIGSMDVLYGHVS